MATVMAFEKTRFVHPLWRSGHQTHKSGALLATGASRNHSQWGARREQTVVLPQAGRT